MSTMNANHCTATLKHIRCAGRSKYFNRGRRDVITNRFILSRYQLVTPGAVSATAEQHAVCL
jgi:hypothetical protein